MLMIRAARAIDQRSWHRLQHAFNAHAGQAANPLFGMHHRLRNG